MPKLPRNLKKTNSTEVVKAADYPHTCHFSGYPKEKTRCKYCGKRKDE